MKSNKEISFRISLPSSTPTFDYFKPNSITIEGKKYFLFYLWTSSKFRYFKDDHNLYESIFFLFMNKPSTWLIVAEDNSKLVKQLKYLKNREDVFSTPFTNLEFRPDFLNVASGASNKTPFYRNGFLVKDNSKIKKIVATNPNNPEINFKVIQTRKLHEKGLGNLELEIEPLDLGIKNFPKINFISFDFFAPDPSRAGAPLDQKKYEALFFNSIGKSFVMKVNQWTFGKWNSETSSYKTNSNCNYLFFQSEEDLEEIKEQNVESENNSHPKSPPNNNGDKDKPQEIPLPQPINSSDPLKAKVEVQNIIINLLINHPKIVLEVEQSNHLWKGHNSWQDKLISLVDIEEIREFSNEMQNYIWQIIHNCNNSPNKPAENGKLKPILIFGVISIGLTFLIIFIFYLLYKKHKNIKKIWAKN